MRVIICKNDTHLVTFYNVIFLVSAAACGNIYRIHCSIDSVAQVASLCLSLHCNDCFIGSGNSGRFMNILSQLFI